MDDLLKKMKDYSRFLELEDSIPYWETQIPNLDDRLAEMKWNQEQKELELLQWQNPNFFQRVFGRAEEKQERFSQQIRELKSARMAAQWERDGLEKQIKDGKQELETLAGSREIYGSAKNSMVLSPAQESRLIMEEISAFAPLALETAWHALEALEDARPWIRSVRVTEGNRKMELLYRAQDCTRRLLKILAALPEGAANPGGNLEHLYDYICGATSEYKQMDRLELVQIQIREIRNQLKLLLGE